ncbi:hypothetical protein CPC08DRAFT_815238 [Agrocybe pediades]|nr:hypothetical protein CPC08DRAFT_815238 [Agrocybe pediades]
MDTLRRRIPFKARDEDAIDDNEILDEQQQEELIDKLREENELVNKAYLVALKVVVGLSLLLQLATFRRNPLLTIYPLQGSQSAIPLPAAFTLLSIFVHLNLLLLLFPEEIPVLFQLSSSINPLSFQLLYSVSAVAPTLCLFLQKPWQTFVWWCFTPVMVFIVQSVMEAIQESNQGIADLETMKYTAPGA